MKALMQSQIKLEETLKVLSEMNITDLTKQGGRIKVSEGDGAVFFGLSLLLGITVLILLFHLRVVEDRAYIQACKDIAEDKCKAELRKDPGGELRWVIKRRDR